MAKKKKEGMLDLSRRDFLKMSAAGAGALAVSGMTPTAAMAIDPVSPDTTVSTYHTSCPYCSAQCGQVVTVGNNTGKVYDIWGDNDSPINTGGLCAKGAGSYQLVTNLRRLGVCNPTSAGTNPDPDFAGKTHPVNTTFNYDPAPAYADGVAYYRSGNDAWSKVALADAMDSIASGLKTARGTAPVPGLTADSNRKTVQFFGCSHMNNEPNYMYRKIIANFGTSNVEHQARI